MKKINLLVLIAFTMLNAAILPTAYFMQKHYDNVEKKQRKECREKRFAYMQAKDKY